MRPSPPRDRESLTVDAFHRGRFHLVQPASTGHRAGLDAMLLASAVPSGFEGRLADLGAGAGAAGFAVAARCPAARVVLVERSPVMADFARRGLALPQNAAFSDRVTVTEADVTLTARPRREAGLDDSSFDAAIMNPPFNAAHDRATGDRLRHEAHVMQDDLLERWLRTAAAIAAPGAWMSVIARPACLRDLLAALAGRFGGATVLPVHPRAGAEAIRIVVRARKGTRAGLRLVPGLFLHETGGRYTERADALIDGRATLFDG